MFQETLPVLPGSSGGSAHAALDGLHVKRHPSTIAYAALRPVSRNILLPFIYIFMCIYLYISMKTSCIHIFKGTIIGEVGALIAHALAVAVATHAGPTERAAHRHHLYSSLCSTHLHLPVALAK